MAATLSLSIVILAVVIPQVAAFYPHGAYVQGYKYGGNDNGEPLTLTCSAKFDDDDTDDDEIVNAVAVTIRERPAGYGQKKFSFGSDDEGLMAKIDIFSVVGGSVVVAVTETSRPELGCLPDDFGNFFVPESDDDEYGNYGNYGNYGGYGGYIGYAGFGAGGYGGYGGYGKGYGYKGEKESDDDIPGVIAKVILAPNVTSSVNIDNLGNFGSLKELAGRGIIICPEEDVEVKGDQVECDGVILACCALHYDTDDD